MATKIEGLPNTKVPDTIILKTVDWLKPTIKNNSEAPEIIMKEILRQCQAYGVMYSFDNRYWAMHHVAHYLDIHISC